MGKMPKMPRVAEWADIHKMPRLYKMPRMDGKVKLVEKYRRAKTYRRSKLDRVAEISTGHNGLKVQNGLNGQFGQIDPNYPKGSKVQNTRNG